MVVLLVPPALYAVTNLLDRFLVTGDGEDSEAGPLMAISGFFNLFFAIGIWVWMQFTHKSISAEIFWPLFANGALYLVAMWIYLRILKFEETTRVVPWFQVIPIFGLIIAWFMLGESFGILEIVAILTMIIGGFVLSIKKGVVNGKLMAGMIIASGLIAANDVIFAHYGRQADGFVPALFADVIGKAFWCSLVLIGKKERRGFFIGLRTKFHLQSSGEIIFIVADGTFDVAKLMAPVAIAQSICCTQSLFAYVGVLALAKLYPKAFAEEKGYGWYKLSGTILMIVGGVILSIIN